MDSSQLKATIGSNPYHEECLYCGEAIDPRKGILIERQTAVVVFHRECLHSIHETLRTPVDVTMGRDGVWSVEGDSPQRNFTHHARIVPPRRKS